MMFCLIISNGVCIGEPIEYTKKVKSGKGIEVIVNEDVDVLKGMMKYFTVQSKEVPAYIVKEIKCHVLNGNHHLARPLIEKHYQRTMCCDAVIDEFVNSL